MSESSKPTSNALPVPAEADLTALDASCRGPVLFLWACSAVWLFIAAFLGLVVSVKLHAPYLLADAAWSTYGRLQPAQLNIFLYGFGIQAGLGVALWLIVRLGGAPLRLGSLVVVGALLWNIGLKLGILAILAGGSTGFEGLEIPGRLSPILFTGYTLIGISALITFAGRRSPQFHPSQWFLLAALFWFPWIYSTAYGMLVFAPARGVVQSVINYWYLNNLLTIWFGCVGLATLLYLLPRLAKRPLHSSYLAMMTFWLLLLCGSWMGMPDSAPLPAWIPSVSTVFSVLTLVAVLAMIINAHRTISQSGVSWLKTPTLALACVAALSWAIAVLMQIALSLPAVSAVAQFTFFVSAHKHLFLYGFFALAMFAAFYQVLPQWVGANNLSPQLTSLHIWVSIAGVLIYFIPMAVGGWAQGNALNDASIPFSDALSKGIMALRMATLGELLFAGAQGALLLNLAYALTQNCRQHCLPSVQAALAEEVRP